jgi:hypothetical protein
MLDAMSNQVPMKREQLKEQERTQSGRPSMIVAKIERTVAKPMNKPTRKSRR